MGGLENKTISYEDALSIIESGEKPTDKSQNPELNTMLMKALEDNTISYEDALSIIKAYFGIHPGKDYHIYYEQGIYGFNIYIRKNGIFIAVPHGKRKNYQLNKNGELTRSYDEEFNGKFVHMNDFGKIPVKDFLNLLTQFKDNKDICKVKELSE